jgi:hypothetical protein
MLTDLKSGHKKFSSRHGFVYYVFSQNRAFFAFLFVLGVLIMSVNHGEKIMFYYLIKLYSHFKNAIISSCVISGYVRPYVLHMVKVK